MKRITLLFILAIGLCSVSKANASSNQGIIEGKDLVKYVLKRSYTVIHTVFVENMSYSNQYVSEISGHLSGPTYFDLYPCGTPGHTTCTGYFPEFELDGSGIIKLRVTAQGIGDKECQFLVDGNTQDIQCFSERVGDYYVFSLSGIDLTYSRQFQFYVANLGNCP